MEMIWLLVGFVIGLGIGSGFAWVLSQGRSQAHIVRLEAEREAAHEKVAWLESAQETMQTTFEALSSRSLRTNGKQIVGYVQRLLQSHHQQLQSHVSEIDKMRGSLTGSVQQLLNGQTTIFNNIKGSLEGKINTYDQHVSNVTATFSGRVHDELTTHTSTIGKMKSELEAKVNALDQVIQGIEVKREGAYQSLAQYLTGLEQASLELRNSAGRLDQALRSGQARGKWGEIQLRKCVEFAGLSEHVTFSEQIGFDGTVPDMIVHLPNGGQICIDAKFPLSAYMDALATDDEVLKDQKHDDHLKSVKLMVKNLADKKYWESIQPSPEMVILFVPIESCLTSVFHRDPEFIEHALNQKVMLASPITLVCFLKAVAFGWQQFTISNNTKEILALSTEFYGRTAKWLEHLRKTGDKLSAAVESYNSTVSSLQSRFFPTLRKFEQAMASQDVLDETNLITQNVIIPPLMTDSAESSAP